MHKKTIIITILILVFTLFICIPATAADASTDKNIKSKNTLKFESAEGSIAIYSDDIRLLADKIYTMPAKTWSPSLYAHSHIWEYININTQTHTKHCSECGSQNDATINHKTSSAEPYDISYNGKKYGGNQYTCECGYQWVHEASHNYVYNETNATHHTVSCALNGTPYCDGLNAYQEMHDFGEPVIKDATHHFIICKLCGAKITEKCVFEVTNDGTDSTEYCLCGNTHVKNPDIDSVETSVDNVADTENSPEPELPSSESEESISTNSL